MRKIKEKYAGLLAAAALAVAGAASADVIYQFNGSGVTTGTVQTATSRFDFVSTSLLHLTLTNTSDIVNIQGVLDDFHFLLSGIPTGASFNPVNGVTSTEGTVDCTASTNTVSTCTITPNPLDSTGTWGIFLTGAQVDMYSNGSKIHPYGIVNDSILTQANLDGLRNTMHNPYLLGATTFDIVLAGLSLTSIPTISNVAFTFGTGPDTVTGTPIPPSPDVPPPSQIPEPQSLALMAIGLLSLAFAQRKQRS